MDMENGMQERNDVRDQLLGEFFSTMTTWQVDLADEVVNDFLREFGPFEEEVPAALTTQDEECP